ncbi:MAG: hypothetical protein WCQ63_05775 [Methanomethylophilus sp.]|nr:hypothetical protein [Methanomethylophilus sp.]MDD4222289.1 hypothetical protein [Methanomethylophilus sp.]MDD4668815.1 hypothetical protein [Methanomethylophilus sp.]
MLGVGLSRTQIADLVRDDRPVRVALVARKAPYTERAGRESRGE